MNRAIQVPRWVSGYRGRSAHRHELRNELLDMLLHGNVTHPEATLSTESESNE